MIKLPKYEDLLLNKKDADRELVGAKVGKAKARLDLEIAKCTEDLATREASLKETCMSVDFNIDRVLEELDGIDSVERTHSQLSGIASQMFPTASQGE